MCLFYDQTYTPLAIESKYMKRWEFDSIAQAAKGLMSWFPGTPYEALLLEQRLKSMIGIFLSTFSSDFKDYYF